jgi:hypothetical protein
MPRTRKTTPIDNPSPNVPQGSFKGGVKNIGVTTRHVDPVKATIVSQMERNKVAMLGRAGRGAGTRTAGMMMDSLPIENSLIGTSTLSTYQSSYAQGLNQVGGLRDIPPYFIMMNEQNGGILYWPVTLKEKYEWYRYWQRTDAYCGRALELLSDLPMSKLSLNMPKMEGKPKELKKKIHGFFTGMCDKLNLFQTLQAILFEYNMIGNCYLFHEWNPKLKMWDRVVMLPPEEVSIFQYPFSENARVEYRPQRLMTLIEATKNAPDEMMSDLHRQIIKSVPEEIVNMIREEGCIVMDSDPSTGSFVHHLARRRSPYLDLGASVLERVLVPMLMKENFRYTQLGLATRNMTPKNKISAPGLTDEQLGDLRLQFDLSYLDPDFAIITNYDWDWQQVGADQRLLDLQAEYEMIENHVFAGLGVTRELLTGEGTYTGNKITVEILNTVFLLTREILQNYVEKALFRPVAEAHGWYDTDEFGIKTYFYPKLGFNRLSIRDNQEVFDSLFQLYQKGSMPIDIIYELFNLNTDEIHERIYNDLFTVKDATFNRVLEEVNVEVGRGLVEKTDILPRVAKYLHLNMAQPPEGEGGAEGGGDGGGGFDLGQGASDEQAPAEEAPAEVAPEQPAAASATEETKLPDSSEVEPKQVEEVAQSISEGLDENATDEDIGKAVDKVLNTKQEEVDKEQEDAKNGLESQAEDAAETITKELGEDATDEDIEKVVDKILEETNQEKKPGKKKEDKPEDTKPEEKAE